MSPARLALLRFYAALDRSTGESEVPLETDLAALGIDMGDLGEPVAELKQFARAVGEERATEANGPPIPLVRVAETAMDAVAELGDAADEDTMRTLTEWLVSADFRANVEIVDRVVQALREASRAEDRWGTLRRGTEIIIQDGNPLRRELSVVRKQSCKDDVLPIDGEWAATITTTFEVDRATYSLDQLAAACMPPNWTTCSDFFCSLTHRPERNAECPPTGADPPRSDAEAWRTVYEEKVLTCPDGAFPDTYLLFTWCRTRTPGQLVLQYELAPPRPQDRPRLRYDEGSIQIETLPNSFRVTTTKLLLFHDGVLPSGGQTLGKYACELGWLDHSIAMFTPCAEHLPASPDQPGRRAPTPEERLHGVLTRCEDHIRQRATEAVGDVDACIADMRSGTSSADAHFAGCTQKVSTRAAADGARWIEGQLDYAVASVDLARQLVDNWRRARASN